LFACWSISLDGIQHLQRHIQRQSNCELKVNGIELFRTIAEKESVKV